jgi:PKD domain-containing protein
MLITGESEDPRFNAPYVDVEEERTTPVPHRYVHGGFTGTDAKFSFYFPPAERYEGRFFQPTHQLFFSEEAQEGAITFTLDSGAYLVQSNMGGSEYPRSAELALSGKYDPTIGGYRVNAAAAKFSRVKAVELYGEHRPFGYLHGPSGGAFQTITSMEHTEGVWDGAVPQVMGSPNAIPGVFTVRIHALRVLKSGDKFAGVMDAIDPGGSGDPYAGLNEEERGALEEATRLGFPMRGWWNWETMTGGPLRLVAGYVPLLEPTYADDFWSKPGYLGTDPKSSVSAARIQHETTVAEKLTDPNRLVLATMPDGDLTGIDLVIGGERIETPPVNAADRTVAIPDMLVARFDDAKVGDAVSLDNSWYLALQTFHRHNVPTPDMYGWNQFRKDGDGDPIYPQRTTLVGPIGAVNGSGALNTGDFKGKMIVLESLVDIEALPWQADWYAKKVEQALGKQGMEDNFRLYFTDNAQHGFPAVPPAHARTVSYAGVLQQALRDVSAWVERGVAPPPSTNYEIDDSQVIVPADAASRRGVQPIVALTVDGGDRADVAVGQPVSFSATIETPPGTGDVVDAEWDFEGAGTYPVRADLAPIGPSVHVDASHTYDKPGTYFAVLRATSQRDGDRDTPHARIQNVARVRVVVS